MLSRAFDATLRGLLRRFPAVAVLGPRQCGKTTFARQALPRWTYLDLERPADAAPLDADPEARLRQLGDHVILDEAQRLPGVFPVLRGVIDRDRSRFGRYLILGSASPALIRGVSESLAGRVAFLDLPPFRWDEVRGASDGAALDALWLRGGFPPAYLASSDRARAEWLDAYTRAVIERDLPALGIDVSPTTMRRLWAMLAHAQGGMWNASRLAASLGVSYHTVNRYVDLLEQIFLVRRLQPYFVNLGKRLVRSPKVYFRDSGLLHHMLGIEAAAGLEVHPSRGASWEGFLIDQLLSSIQRAEPAARPWFYRTAQGHEIDLLVEVGSRLVPFELKLHSAPSSGDAAGLRASMAQLRLSRGYVVYPGNQAYSLGTGVTVLPAARLLADTKLLRQTLNAAR
jgi:hypothetical protein